MGWRAWVGGTVVCKHCGCVLSTWVHHCPDCGQTGTWKRSKAFFGFQRTDVFYFWFFCFLVIGVSIFVLSSDYTLKDTLKYLF